MLPAILWISVVFCASCTSLHPTEATSEQIQYRIIHEDLLKSGEQVELVTSDRAVHEFRITDIDREQGLVVGKNESVPVSDIVAVKTREFSMGKTALLAGGVTYGLWIWFVILLGPVLVL
jgi:hypothetical protein